MFSSTLLFLDIGAQEFVIILFIALLLFGGDKLPGLARGLGKGIRDFKDASEGVKREISNQIDNFETKSKTEENKEVTTEQPAVTEYNHEEYRYEDGNFDDVHKHTGVANTIPAVQSHVVANDQLDEEEQPVDYYAFKSGENQAEDTDVSNDKDREPNKS